jgi:hypothetical protein
MEGKDRMALADEDVVVAAIDTADAVKEEAEASREEEDEEEREMLPAGYWCRTSGPRSGWKRA